MLSTKKGKEAYVEPVSGRRIDYRFEVRVGATAGSGGGEGGDKAGKGRELPVPGFWFADERAITSRPRRRGRPDGICD